MVAGTTGLLVDSTVSMAAPVWGGIWRLLQLWLWLMLLLFLCSPASGWVWDTTMSEQTSNALTKTETQFETAGTSKIDRCKQKTKTGQSATGEATCSS